MLDNITIAPIRILKEKRAAAERHARDLLERVRLADKVAAYPGQLSGGQQQRGRHRPGARHAAGPRAVRRGDLGPRSETVGEVLAVIRGLVQEGMTSLLVTHEMRFAEEISDRIVFTENGRIVEDGPPEQIFHRSQTRASGNSCAGSAPARQVQPGEGI